MSATTVSEEYWRAHQHLGFSWGELVKIALISFDLPSWSEKQALLARVKARSRRWKPRRAPRASPARATGAERRRSRRGAAAFCVLGDRRAR